jgi:hypothetical protein
MVSGRQRDGNGRAAERARVTALEAALGERQLLLEADTPLGRSRATALGLRIAALLDQLSRLSPPQGTLEDEAAAPGEFDRFLGSGDAERLAG